MICRGLFILAIAVTAQALTTDEVLEKTRTALGGVAALKALPGLETLGNVHMDQMSGTTHSLWFGGNRLNTEIDLGVIVLHMGMDSTGPWMVDFNGGVAQAGGDQAIDIAVGCLMTGWYCFRPDSGTEWKYVGDDKDGNPCLEMKLPIGDGYVSELVIDGKTWLPKTLIAKQGMNATLTEYGDYRKVAGVFAPFAFKDTQGSHITQHEIISITTFAAWDDSNHSRPVNQEIFTMTGDKTEWPIKMMGNYMMVEGTINGEGPYTFFVDTGASNSVIDLAVADKVGLKQEGGMQGEAIGGDVQVTFGKVKELTIAGITFKNNTAAIIDLMSNVGKYFPSITLGGIIGYDLLGRFAIELHYDSSQLILYRPGKFEPQAGMKMIPMEISEGIISIKGKLEGKDITMMVDTGNSSSLHISSQYVEKEKLLENRKTAMGWWGGAAGMEEGRIGRVKSLEIAGFEMKDIICEFSTTEAGVLGNTNDDANLGGEILSRFVIVFDFPGNRMGLLPLATVTKNDEPERMGMMTAPQVGGIAILKLDPDGSAAKGGLQVGDFIAGVDGTNLLDVDLFEIRSLFRQPAGTVLKLKVRRGEQELEIPVTLIDRF